MNEFLRALIIIASVSIITVLLMTFFPQVRETPLIIIIVGFGTLWIVRSFLPK